MIWILTIFGFFLIALKVAKKVKETQYKIEAYEKIIDKELDYIS